MLEDDGGTSTPAATTATLDCKSVPQVLTLNIAPVTGEFPGMPSTRGHAVQLRGLSYIPKSVSVNGVAATRAPNATRCVPQPCWYETSTASHSLVEPAGSIIVLAGNEQPTTVSVMIVVAQ